MPPTIPGRLFEQARKQPSAPAYVVREGGVWRATSYRAYADEVKRAAKALIALGFEPGQSVAILGFNRPEWVVLDVACMAAGGAPAGIYTTCSTGEVHYIVHHCEAPLVLCEDAAQVKKVNDGHAGAADPYRGHPCALRHIVTMRGAPAIDDPKVLGWDEFLARGDDVPDADLFARIDHLQPDALATLIYTSGTTGPPKGVMLSHENLAWTADAARRLNGSGPDDCVLSYLPLSHIAEQMFSIHCAITSGYQVCFAEAIERVPDNLKEVRPTLFFGVPRIWEKLHSGIAAKLGQATGLKKALADQAMRVGRKVAAVKARGGTPSGALALQHRLFTKLVYAKVKDALGLGRARTCVSGAAPIAREVLEFLAGVDIVVMEVYGQSEDTGPTSFNRPDRFRFGTVGPPIPGIEVKIAPDGEILVRGPNVFLGYYKDEAATAETLRDGWLASGDLGEIDEGGFLTITGRKKEIIITAGGKNIAPKNIENALKTHPLINEAVVIGDRRKYLTCLVTLDPEAAARWAKEHGVAVETLADDPQLRTEIQKAVDEVNSQYARVEQVKRFTILRRNLGIDTGELTPTLKVKREAVARQFASEIESMYAE